MNVREMTWDDFEGLFALRSGRYDEVAKDPDYGMVTNPKRPSRADFAAWFGEAHRALLEKRTVISVAEESGKILGMARIVPEGDHPETNHVGVLGLEVLGGQRGKGVGTALLAHALESARGRFSIVQLAVVPGNAAALRVYRKLGFQEHGRLPRAFQRNGVYHDFVLMHRTVGP